MDENLLLVARFARCLKLKLFTGGLHRQSRWFPLMNKKKVDKFLGEICQLILAGGNTFDFSAHLPSIVREGAFVGDPQVPTTFERSGRPARRRLTSIGSQSPNQTKKHLSRCLFVWQVGTGSTLDHLGIDCNFGQKETRNVNDTRSLLVIIKALIVICFPILIPIFNPYKKLRFNF